MTNTKIEKQSDQLATKKVTVTILDFNTTDSIKFVNNSNNLGWYVSQEISFTSIYSSLFSNLYRKLFKPQEMTSAFIREAIEKGIDKNAYNMLRSVIGSTSDELNRVIRIADRTVHRRETFKPEESERILRVASVFQQALSLFEDINKARNWFSTPKKSLYNNSPLEYCDTEIGANDVKDLLGRIEYGVF